MRRGADDPRAAISVGRTALGNATDRFQKQHVLFGKHGISSSAMVPPLVWRDAGIHEPGMLPEVDFRTFSRKPKNGFVRRVKYFAAPASKKPRLPNR
jgi:hypothetical protein